MPYSPLRWWVYVLWCVSPVLLFIYYMLLRRMRFSRESAPVRTQLPGSLGFTFERLDYVSLAIVAVLACFWWIGYAHHPPFPPDNIYHLLVAQHIVDDGAIPLWNYWEYAPLGRPHLYPPLYHLMIAGCAAMYGGDVLAAYRTVQPFVLPFCYLCVWLFARWLFGARRAFFALLLLGSDPQVATIGTQTAPALLAGAFATLMTVLFFSGHVVGAIVCGTLSAYAHASIMPMAILGLAAFCVWQRVHGFRLVVLFSGVFLLASPLTAWLWVHREVFRHPFDIPGGGASFPRNRLLAQLSWLQMVNVGVGLVVLRAVRLARWRDPGNRLLLVSALAFLPMLIRYGGRYFIQTMGLWCTLAAGVFASWDWHPLTVRRKIRIGLLPFLPSVVFVGAYVGIPVGPIPLPSAWCLPPAVAAGATRLILDGESVYAYTDILRASEFIRAHTDPDTIIFVMEEGSTARFQMYPLALYAHRRTNLGAWEETAPGPQEMALLKAYVRSYRGKACYAGFNEAVLPPDTAKTRVGRFWIGIRQPAIFRSSDSR